MEVIKSSPVQDCSGMENDRGNDAAKLSNSKRKKIGSWCKKKLDARLESSDKREDTENPESKQEVPHRNADIIIESSIKNDINAGLGTAVPVDQKRTVSSAAAAGDGKASISKRKGCTEIVKGEKESSRTATVDVKIRSKREEHMEIANDMTGSSTNKSLDAKDTMPKRQQHMKSAIGETVSSGTAIIDANTGSKREKDMETASCETISGKFATPDAKMVSKRKKHAEVANGEMGSGTTNNLNVNGAVKKKGELVNPPCLEDMGTANGETDSGRTATDNTTSKKRKKRKLKNKNPASGALLSTQDDTQDMVTEKEGTNRSEVLEAMCGESIPGKAATPDAKMLSKGEHTKVANDEIVSSTTKNLDLNDTVNGETDSGRTATDNTTSKKRKKRKLKNKNPASGALLSTQDGTQDMVTEKEGTNRSEVLEAMCGESIPGKTATPDAKTLSKGEHTKVANDEMVSSTTKNLHLNDTVNGETDSGRTATDNTTSKKRKKRKLKNKNPASGTLLSTQDGTQDMVTEKEGTNRSEVLEAMCGESIPGKTTATPDAKMLSKGEHTKVANDEMVSSTAKNLDLNDAVKKGKKQTAKNRRPTLGEILNPRYLQDLETAMIAANNKKSEKRKRQKLKKQKLVSDEILTACESTQDMVVAKKDSGTNNVREATSTESNEALTRKMQTQGSNKEKTINVIAHVPTLEKKLIIFDVNGLLADIVSPPPKGVKADKNIPKRAIFKRPFLDDFLCFCFERFKVGIWSSRTKKVLDPVVQFLLGDLRMKLLFVWDASECTRSWKKTLEDKHKCIVFKDLRKVWTRNGPGGAWVKGVFNESNTLLVDDSPYKALLNPKHTGIFPAAYSYQNTDDNFLGPNGDLRAYLEGVAATDNLKMYVEQHPFGQGAIDESSPHWGFYSRLLKG